MFRIVAFFTLFVIIRSEKQTKFYNTKCNFNPKWIENGTCFLKILKRNVIRANVDYDLILPMKNVSVQIVLSKFYSQFRPFMINEWAQLCKYLKYPDTYNFFVRSAYRILIKYTNSIICEHPVNMIIMHICDLEIDCIVLLF